PIIPDHDIIIMSDEAHRSHYGVFADNMVGLLPTASRIGFTGTPLLSNDNITERTFGGYISIYDFKRAVEDKATVPLYYENRGEKILDIQNPDITDRILDAIEAADFDAEQTEKLEHEFKKEIHILTTETRLCSIAKDFVAHYSDLWTSGKAMFVCLNKVTCVRMYNYVQEYWREEIKALMAERKTASQQEVQELDCKIKWMMDTEMAVVISQEQNEIQTFKKWDLDIKPHREKMEKRELDKEFKDKENHLRIVFVCAMWLTGFDVKCLSCLYLDKPLKAHALMQTIARANRVAEGKSNGLIIDYIGIVKALRKALADYTANVGGRSTDPTVDKGELIDRVLEVMAAASEFLFSKGFILNDLVSAKDFSKLALLQEAANAVSDSRESKKQFITYGNEINRMMKYLDRHDISGEDRQKKDAIIAIYDVMKKKKKHVDTVDLMAQINGILGEYILIEQMPENGSVEKRFDISKIDFDLLRREFAKVKKKNLMFAELDELIQTRIDSMLKANPKRVDYYERYQKIIEEYNQEQDRANIEKIFLELIDLANSMTQEEQRYVREGFTSDEELSLYDMLFDENLSKEDIKKIKTVAVELLDKIKSKISELDHWTDKQETKAEVEVLIRDILWTELPECYSNDAINTYKQKIYEYVYIRYKEVV
ncbi:MAG: DUF3387 domain-containing protein, partial [Lachnospiraceae bacterium]|nr:DUF3387 domain-containing protein [Lachnospiraceae bacterium]